MKSTIRLRAFAKINLGLKVLGLRPDGYHEIRTVLQTVALHDRITLRLVSKPGITLRCEGGSAPDGPGNLVYRACRLWMKERKWKGGVQADLVKVIPTGGGLGGGSSDAAATLMGLERLTGEKLSLASRLRIAAELGSDVPAFLFGGTVLGCGRGEEIYPLIDLPRRHCLVAHPGFAISTADAYRQMDGRAGEKLTSSRRDIKLNTFGVWSQFPINRWGPAENDFEAVVFAKWPELEKLKGQFIRAGAETASLTGSGSAIYAIFDSARQLIRAARQAPQGWSVFKTQTLSRRRYHRLVFQA